MSLAARVRALAREAGFDLAGVAAAAPPPRAGFLSEWVARGHAGEMRWLAEQAERRSDVRRSFPWARSVVCVGLQYDTEAPRTAAAKVGRGWISRYAWGDDYHDVMRRLLRRLCGRLQAELGPLEARAFADTGPVAEKAYAAAAGLGSWGKNACLLHPEHGSFFFLGTIVTDLELTPDAPRPDLCGSCRACLDACPTAAFPAPYVLDATRCISYLTIELRGAVPEALREGMGRHVFGCDLCQDVCPWNQARRSGGAAFAPRAGLLAPDLLRLSELDEAGFRALGRRSAIARARRRGLLRNVAVALGNAGGAGARAALERLARDADPLVREHAEWALGRLAADD